MLTDAEIKSNIAKAKAEERTIVIRDKGGKVKGLQLRVSYGGQATFSYVYKPKGEASACRVWLGHYSTAFGLPEARKAAEVLQGKRAAGIDPLTERRAIEAEQRQKEAQRKAQEEADRSRTTVAELGELFLRVPGASRPRTYVEVFAHDIKPTIGKLIADDVKRADVQRVVDRVVARGAVVQARRVFEQLRAILRFGVGRDYLTGEPWKGVVLPAKSEARERVLSAADLRWFWNAIPSAWATAKPTKTQRPESYVRKTTSPAGTSRALYVDIVRLQILLGQRSGEVCGMERREFSADLMTWTIPRERSKNGEAHAVPLPPMARSIIQRILASIEPKQSRLFVGTRGKPIRIDAIAHAVADLIEAHNEGKPEAEHIAPFTPHDFRRTCATGLEAMGVPLSVISATLNHISTKAGSVTSKHYAHADQSMEIRGALTRWQATVETILAGADPFETRAEDIEDLERRMLAKGFGGPARLRVVS